LAELWDERDFVSGLPILVDEKRLIEISDVLVVPGLVVVLVADLGALLVEGGLWRHAEVHPLNSVGLLVVPSDDGASDHGSADGLLPITTSLLRLVAECGEVVEGRVGPYHSESNLDVEESSSFLHDEPRIESWPDLDVVSVQGVSAGWIEGLWPDSLEPECPHHGVEEDLQEDQVVSVGGLHDLNPLDRHLVLGSIVLGLVDREVGALPETVDTGPPANEEL